MRGLKHKLLIYIYISVSQYNTFLFLACCETGGQIQDELTSTLPPWHRKYNYKKDITLIYVCSLATYDSFPTFKFILAR